MYGVSLGGSVDFAGQQHFTGTKIHSTTPIKGTLIVNMLPTPRFTILVLVLSQMLIYLDLEKTSFMTLEAWDQQVGPKTLCIL